MRDIDKYPDTYNQMVIENLQDFLAKYSRVPKYIVIGAELAKAILKEMSSSSGVTVTELKTFSGIKVIVANISLEDEIPGLNIKFLLE